MADGPFGPWVTASGPAAPDGPLLRAGLADLAKVYQELFRVSGGNIGPREADQLHIWEIGVLFGRAEELAPVETEGEPAKVVDFHQHALAKIEQRIRAAEGTGPQPQPSSLDLAQFPSP